MAMEGTADQQPQQSYLPRWKRNKKSAKSKEKAADVNDPCCPSADGYGEYRNREQIERQSNEVVKLQKQQQDHVAQHFASQTTATTQQGQPSKPAPPFLYSVQQPVWFYRDNTSGAIQGPFSGEQMMGWRAFFPATTPVQFGLDRDAEFVALSEVGFKKSPVPPPPPPPVEDAVSADKTVNDSNVFNNTENKLDPVPEVETDDTQQSMPSLTNEDEAKPPKPEVDIAEPTSPTYANEGPEVQMCFPPPSDDEGCDFDGHVDESNDADVKINDGPEVDACVPPPSDDDTNENNFEEGDDHEADLCVPPPTDDEADENNFDEEDGHEADLCVLPPSDDEEEEVDQSEILYPAVGEHPEYPVPEDDDVVPYPADVEYPVEDDAYGYPDTGDAYGDVLAGEMSAIAPYPSAADCVYGISNDSEQQLTEGHGVMPPTGEKKKYDGDRAVVGFMPSHLRVKRNVTKLTKKKSLAKQEAVSSTKPSGTGKEELQGNSVADDYHKFMDEISELK